MFQSKKMSAAATLLGMAVFAIGADWLAPRSGAHSSASTTTKQVTGQGKDDSDKKTESPTLVGVVAAVTADAKGFTLETYGAERNAKPQRTIIKIGDKTIVNYRGVGTDGAMPTEGYGARVRMVDGSKDLPALVIFQGRADPRMPDLTGKVVATAKDGKGIVVEGAPSTFIGGLPQAPKKVEVSFDDKTLLIFSAVVKGGAKIVAGYDANVFLVDSNKGNTVAMVRFTCRDNLGKPDGKRPDLEGEVASVAPDGKAFTLAKRPRTPAEQPEKLEIKLDKRTSVVFSDVGLDGATIVEGQKVSVWLEEGTKDQAARLSVIGVPRERWTRLRGNLAAMSSDGATMTLNLAPAGRGLPGRAPTFSRITITPSTKISYSNVGPGEAKPTRGYGVIVTLADDTADTARQVQFVKPGNSPR